MQLAPLAKDARLNTIQEYQVFAILKSVYIIIRDIFTTSSSARAARAIFKHICPQL